MGRFQAAFGMSSLARTMFADEKLAKITRQAKAFGRVIRPPGKRRRDDAECRSGRKRLAIDERKYRIKSIFWARIFVTDHAKSG